jgi:PBSX family phage terminase large subunit
MISEKQQKILAFPYTSYDSLICDGAVRSGKTSIMSVSFVEWAMRCFNKTKFGICGKTVDSAIKNIIVPLISMTWIQQRYSVKWRRAEKILELQCGEVLNFFEVFGGKDESSYTLIQGRTLGGIFLDEVALMPESFVNQALARCSVNGARFWFNCNPSTPQHWFNVNWIKQAKEKNACYLHFNLEDNPSLSEKTLQMYKTMYSGIFYKRYILGEWVSADGLIYTMFNADKHVREIDPGECEGEYYVSCDFGIQNATVFLLWRKLKGSNVWACIDECYYSGRETKVEKTVSGLVEMLKDMLKDVKPKKIIVDPSAVALITELRKNGYRIQRANNDVLNGISIVSNLLEHDRLIFSPKCENTIREFGLYSWDTKAADRGEDVPVKVSDHAMDSLRYFVMTKKLNAVSRYGGKAKPEKISPAYMKG